MQLSVSDLAKRIGADLVGSGKALVSSVNTLEEARPGQVSFLTNSKYEKLLAKTKASAVIAGPGVKSERTPLLVADDPYHVLMKAIVLLHGHRKHPHKGIHRKAHVEPTATVGEGSILYPGVYVGPRARIGKDCVLYPNAVVYDDCLLHDRVTLHAGAVVGVDGFGYATHKGIHHKIPAIGVVIIEEDVEIGANVAIQRATLGCTIIGHGTKMGDLIEIGHAVHVGPHALLVALTGIAGSTRTGHHLTMGGQSGIAGHLAIGNHVTVAAQSGVMNDVADKAVMYGAPAMPAPHGRKAVTILTQLPELLERLRRLEQQVADLQAEP